MFRNRLIIAVFVLLLSGSASLLISEGCSPASDSQALPENHVSKHTEERLAGTPVRQLASIDTLRYRFRADSGNVRIISILSPT